MYLKRPKQTQWQKGDNVEKHGGNSADGPVVLECLLYDTTSLVAGRQW